MSEAGRTRPEASNEEDLLLCGFEGGKDGFLEDAEATAEGEGEGIGGCEEGGGVIAPVVRVVFFDG